jgi:hypothetical protein
VTLRQDAAGVDDSTLTTVSQALVAVKDWTFLLGPGYMAVLNALCLGTVLYRSGLVPRIIPALGLVGAPMLFASSTGTLFGLHDQVSGSAMLLMLPIGIWELSVGLYMTFKGFKPVPVAEDAPVVAGSAAYSSAAA